MDFYFNVNYCKFLLKVDYFFNRFITGCLWVRARMKQLSATSYQFLFDVMLRKKKNQKQNLCVGPQAFAVVYIYFNIKTK